MNEIVLLSLQVVGDLCVIENRQ